MFKTLNDKSTKLICHKEQAGASKRADKRREKSVAIYFLHEGKNFFQLNFVIHIYMSSWYALNKIIITVVSSDRKDISMGNKARKIDQHESTRSEKPWLCNMVHEKNPPIHYFHI